METAPQTKRRFSTAVRFRVWVLMLALLLTALATIGNADDIVREERPDSWRADAQINDVCFVNKSLGWAVGDQGLVLRTTNGGQTWIDVASSRTRNNAQSFFNKVDRLKPIQSLEKLNPMRCRFHTVHFANEQYGWLAGSYTVPYLNRSRAIVMQTNDGGVTWESIKGLVLPRVNRIKFSDRLNGWAIGATSNLFQTGLFRSGDGGQTWSTHGSNRLPEWRDADPVKNGFVTVNEHGNLGRVIGAEYDRSAVQGEHAVQFNAVRMIGNDNGWAAGDDGALYRTSDGGRSWHNAVASAGPGLKHFDFETMSVNDNRVWVAGTPGTYVFSVDVTTGVIQRYETSVKTPLTDIEFVSKDIGWAVGTGGVILGTTDGGQTWNTQRGKQNRIGLLAVADEPSQLPFEMLARYAVEENVYSATVCLSNSQSHRAKNATSRLGCSMALNLGVQSIEDESRAIERMVRSIRMLQPNVIVAGAGRNRVQNGLRTSEILRAAIRCASDRSKFPQQITDAGLSVWQVDRLVVSTGAGQSDIVSDPRRLLPRTGQLLEDYVAISRAQLGLPVSLMAKQGYSVENFSGNISVRNNDVFSGLRLAGRSIPKRPDRTRMGSLSAVERASAKHKQLAHLLGFKAETAMDIIAWRPQVNSFGLGQSQSTIGVWLFQLADEYAKKGQVELAAHTLELMLTRVGDHFLTAPAMVWLAQYYASDEFHRITFKEPVMADSQIDPLGDIATQQSSQGFRTVPREIGSGSTKAIIWVPVENVETPEALRNVVQQVTHNGSDGDIDRLYEQQRTMRLETASRVLSRLRRVDPDIVQNAQVRFIEAQIVRKMKGDLIAENLYRTLIRSSESTTGLTESASRELNLDAAQTMDCIRISERPHLDGRLDDEAWAQVMNANATQFIKMTPPDTNASPRTDMFMVAYDDEFLYFAARCNKISGQSYAANHSPRPRDPDLSRRDRLAISLDIDRDYRSKFELTMDHRGWVAERLGGSSAWNPVWYVDADQDEKAWVAECAIPLSEIFGTNVTPGSIAAIHVDRLSYDSISLWPTEHQRTMTRTATNVTTGLLDCLSPSPVQMKLLKFK